MLLLDKFYNHPHVRAREHGDLVSFCYTESATYERVWDEVTRAARGIIFNRVTGELVSRPWEKFFNLDEMPETTLSNLRSLNKKYCVAKKMDGSLGVHYVHNGEHFIATKGSFESDQAIWGTEWLRENVDVGVMDREFTYLFEIIYPSNKIVIDYKGKSGLVLLGMIYKKSGLEVSPNILKEWADKIHTECVEYVTFYSLVDLITTCKGLIGEEGYVVTFSNIDGKDLKVKVKGEWYKRLHKIISNLTLLAFWDAWKVGGVDKEYLEIVPEEFRDLSDRLALAIDSLHEREYDRVRGVYDEIMGRLTQNDVKHFALECQASHKKDLGLLINLYKEQEDRLWDGIHKRVRPTGNVLPWVDKNLYDRVNRVNEDA